MDRRRRRQIRFRGLRRAARRQRRVPARRGPAVGGLLLLGDGKSRPADRSRLLRRLGLGNSQFDLFIRAEAQEAYEEPEPSFARRQA